MSRPRLNAEELIDLNHIAFLLIDDDPNSVEIITQELQGFGAWNIARCTSAADGREKLIAKEFDFVIVDAHMPAESGYSFVEWLRRSAPSSNRYIPAIIVTGHSQATEVTRARDCGAHFVIAKPVVPKVLLDRISWIGREHRMFIETDTYCGPDRRFKHEGPPPGTKGRRCDDLSPEVGAAAAPNLSQDMINALLKPSRVKL